MLIGFLLSYERQPERMLYTLAFWMGFLKLLRRAFEVSTHVLQLRRHLLLERELLQVDRVVRVGSDGRVGVLLPRERLGSADDDLKTVVVDGAGEGARQSAFGDEGLHGLFHLRTEGLERRLGFITCYLRSEKLVDYFIIVLCALRLIVVSIHCFNDYVNRATPFSMAIALRIAA